MAIGTAAILACHCIGQAKAIPVRHRAQVVGDDDWLLSRLTCPDLQRAVVRCSESGLARGVR